MTVTKLNSKTIYIILFLSLFVSLEPAISQISYETSKALLIFQFANNISHENEKGIKKYKICFLGNDIKTYQELEKLTANNRIKGKLVELSFVDNLDQIPEIQLLYIDKTWVKKIEEVWLKIENKNILLVSEQCPDAKYIMLNILRYQAQEKVDFEINKANMIIENLSFNPELLLLGGKEVDIRELYRDMKQRLEKEKQDVEQYKQVLREQTAEIAVLHKQTDSLRTNINVLTEKISKSEGKLNYLSDSVKIQQDILLSKLSQIRNQETKLANQKNEIRKKENEIKSRTNELDNIIAEKVKQQDIINEQEITLLDQENIISTKNQQLSLTVVFALMLMVLTISILYALRTKKKASKKQLIVNRRLGEQKLILEKTLKNLTNTKSKLIQSEKMASLGVLTAGIAHEINNPVNYISSGLEGLKTVSSQIINVVSKYQEYTKEKNQEIEQNIQDELSFLTTAIQTLTKNIQTGVNRTTKIIKSLNAFSRVDDDKLSLSDLHENIDLTTTLLHNKYKNRIEIIKNYNKIPQTYCYSSKLNQVFMNILSNAIQAVKDKGTITITTEHIEKSLEDKKGGIKISIKDTGIGIPKEIQGRIFEPFFTTKQVGQGTGLGLSITHGIIEQHKGTIKLNSTDKGTEFEIYIPVK